MFVVGSLIVVWSLIIGLCYLLHVNRYLLLVVCHLSLLVDCLVFGVWC